MDKKSGKRPLVVSILIVVLAALGYLGYPAVHETGQAPAVTEKQGEEITYRFRSDKLWEEHYEKHGIEMGFENKEDYLLAANRAAGSENALHKLEKEDGDDVYYLEETNEFVIISSDGYLRTYFNPSDGIEYYNRQ